MENDKKVGARKKLLNLFFQNIGMPFAKDKLAETAGVHDWPRVLRMLRQEGYDLELLKDGSYVMKSSEINPAGNKRGAIDRKTRYRILLRDDSKCQRCGKTIEDGVKLHIDHKVPVDMGGSTTDDNLWVLCEECNLGKQSWFSDEDADLMKEVFSQDSGFKRLETYFKLNPNKIIEPTKLRLVSDIRDWERTLRLVRAKSKMNIKYFDKKSGTEGYMYITE